MCGWGFLRIELSVPDLCYSLQFPPEQEKAQKKADILFHSFFLLLNQPIAEPQRHSAVAAVNCLSQVIMDHFICRLSVVRVFKFHVNEY